ncbi:MAG: hypothetical protein HFK02_04485 [Clostridia bacterium]|jgi:hypothetical protein|nr:hypothetical protein [Clostridia bacterium]
MNGFTQKKSKEKTAHFCAAAENKFTSAQLKKEMLPLLKDCFICEVAEVNDFIGLKFFNGQKFAVSVKEISN